VNKLVKWLIFSVIAALAPLVFHYMSALTTGKEVSFLGPISGGELLLLSVALAAVAIGENYMLGNNHLTRKLILGGLSLLSLLLASYWYAYISTFVGASEAVDRGFVGWGSIIIYAVTLVLAGLTIGLPTKTERQERG